jgi:hypothetical protein
MKIKNGEDLKNGDEITIDVNLKENFLKENRLKLKSDTIKIKVEGLDETEAVDLFEDLKFEISGISPNLTLYVTNNSKDTFIKTVSYSIEFDDESSYYSLSGLANGDKVTIKATYSDSNLAKSGYIVASDTYEYTIENQPYYVNSSDEVSKETLEDLKEIFFKKIQNSAKDSYTARTAVNNIDDSDDYHYSDTFTASDPSLVKAYVLTAKLSSNTTRNKVYAIYKVTFTSDTGTAYDYYFTINTSNVSVDSEGLYTGITYNYDVSSVYGSSAYAKSSEDAYNYFIDVQKSSYDIKEME